MFPSKKRCHEFIVTMNVTVLTNPYNTIILGFNASIQNAIAVLKMAHNRMVYTKYIANTVGGSKYLLAHRVGEIGKLGNRKKSMMLMEVRAATIKQLIPNLII